MTKRANHKILSVCYDRLRGVDFSGRAGEKNAFSLLENMYIDYEGGSGCIESIPGFRILFSFKKRVHGIFLLENLVFVHAGEGLYAFDRKERDNIHAPTPILSLPDCPLPIVCDGKSLWILTEGELVSLNAGGEILRFDRIEEISRCRIMTKLGKRIFLSGDKLNPCRVYFADFDGNGAPIFSQNAYFDLDGRVNNLLCEGERLWILTCDGAYSYTQSSQEFSSEKKLGAISVFGGIYFLDRMLFCSSAGLYSADGDCLSEEITPKFLRGDTKDVSLICWRGYLALCRNGEIFLADPRAKCDGSDSFDWYYLRSIGTYSGDMAVYCYSPTADDGFAVHPSPDKKAEGLVMSLKNAEGKTVYYTEGDGVRYALYPTYEREGGVFSPADKFASDGELLYFATGSGDLCVFNSDMRGTPPKYLEESAGFDPSEYKRLYGDEIHPHFYSFASHRAEYRLKTPDDCIGMPSERKNTRKGSLSVECRCFSRSSMEISVICDGREIMKKSLLPTRLDFSEIDFENLSAPGADRVKFSIPEHQNGWINKQISIYGGEFCSPIGIYSLFYDCKRSG